MKSVLDIENSKSVHYKKEFPFSWGFLDIPSIREVPQNFYTPEIIFLNSSFIN